MLNINRDNVFIFPLIVKRNIYSIEEFFNNQSSNLIIYTIDVTIIVLNRLLYSNIDKINKKLTNNVLLLIDAFNLYQLIF